MRRYFHFVVIALILSVAAGASADSLSVSAQPTGRVKPKRSPMGALLRSVVVPGWGQFYNHKYIKSAVVCVAESYFIVRAVYWWRETERQYDRVLATTNQGQQYSIYQTYRGRRDDFLWAAGVTIFVSMFDAYVDAHLAGFDVDVTPDFRDPKGGASLKLSLRF